jgi:hypothetical protein
VDVRVTALEAARRFAVAASLPADDLAILKDGSNLLVHLAPAPVVLRIATFTAAIRGDPEPYLARELDLVSFLASAGASVAPPSDLVAPRPHLVAGWWMSAWRYVEHERGVVPDPLTSLAALDELQVAMRPYPGRLPVLNPALDDLDRALRFAVQRELFSASQADDMRGRRDQLAADLLATAPERQAQHGDAFARNSLVTANGVVWIDFEDCCEGPLLWDLATLLRHHPDDAVHRILVGRHGEDALRTAIDLRQAQVDVWMALHDAHHKFGW